MAADTSQVHLMFQEVDAAAWRKPHAVLETNSYWSWYEPDPVSLLGKGIGREKLQPLLRRGLPQLPPGVEFESLLIFADGQGVIVRSLHDGTSAVHWRETTSGEGTVPVMRVESHVLLRSDERLMSQFGIDLSDAPDLPQRLRLVRYLSQGETITWSLLELDENKEKSA